MFEALLKRLLAPAPERLPEADCSLALAALLVRIARTDGLYAAEEVEQIDRALMRRYDLDALGAASLRARAEVLEAEAPDTVRFTRALKEATALEEREVFLEKLWAVALADGSRDATEDQLVRMVTRLLGLTDVQSATARERARLSL